MTIGIYRLVFPNTNKVYIGQSTDIEKRFRAHISTFTTNTATYKLQEAYRLYGKPSLEILIECSLAELNNAETEAVQIFNSYKGGFNSSPGGDLTQRHGDNSPNAKYTNNTYYGILCALISKDNLSANKQAFPA